MSKTSSNEPLWLRNHWRIFESIIIRSDFTVDIEQLREKQLALPLIASNDFMRFVRKHEIPVTCICAAGYLYANPNATGDELKSKIISPIRWVHPSMGIIGPAGVTGIDFDAWKQVRTGHFGPSILIEIQPNTKVSEIKNFIDENKYELVKALKLNPSWTRGDYPVKYANRIDKPDYVGEKALKLKDTGKTTPEVLDELNLRDKVDESNMRAKLSIIKKQRTERNKSISLKRC